MDGRCYGGDGGEVSWFLLLHLLVLLTPRLKQFAVVEKGLGCELGLVLEMDPISGLMLSHNMLQNHNLSISSVLG